MISRRTLLLGAAGLAAGSSLTALSACAQIPEDYAGVQPLGQRTFADYVLETRAWIAGHRQFVTDDHAAEMSYNAPSETRPAEWPPKTGAVKGILLVHGLGDSPWSFVDQAKSYAEAGWLVRTVLLPGCGTRPEDMVRPTADDWRRVVREQAEILHRDLTSLNPGAEVWLGGFSTGCNLVTEFAYQHDWVEGLVLFSPAYAVRTRLAFLAPAASHVVTWLRKPEDSMMGGHTPFRYTIVPTQALAAFVDTMEASRSALESRPFTKPVVVMMAEHDSVVDTEELLPVISRQMVNPQSRILWYGNKETAQKLAAGDTRVIVRTDVVPEFRVTSFSHMGMLYRPDNPRYGAAGSDRICRREGEKASSRLCLEAPEDAVFYGAWGDKSAGTVRARLTFNPWYAAQEADIRSVMR